MTAAIHTVTAHLRILQGRLESRTTESPEALLADLIPDLIRSLSGVAGRPGVDLLGQAYEAAIGRPDFSVKQDALLIGHVETKAPGTGADVARLRKQHDREQWKRFQNLPNVLYTDGTAFSLYRTGERDGEVLALTFDREDPQQEAAPHQVTQLVALLSRFLEWRAVAPATLSALAEQLAPRCAVLRDAVRGQLDDLSSEVSKAAAEFEASLFPGHSREAVADAFAQVCAYSMLLARSSGATTLDGSGIEAALGHGHPVLGRVVRVLLDAQTESELGWALETIRALIEVVDFERLRHGRPLPGMTHHEQTWLYFYETFLARYDPRLRDQYGVYYTPQQVIGAQVALVEDVLRTRLGMPLGLASPDVTVLDPAVGTGSYPIRVALHAAQTAEQMLGSAAVPGVIGGLARNLHAFEALVGPYAVAHLRLAEVFETLGAQITGDAVNVYLTDTLSSPHADPAQLTRLLDPLVEEQRRALRVKGQVPVLVCLGNPPYERGRRGTGGEGDGDEGSGGWVVHGEGPASRAIFEDLLEPARKAGAGGHLKNLYNAYVYFWRWALWKVFETGDAGGYSDTPGVVSFITASSYLAGPAFGGLRERLRRACDEVWIIDLGGEGRGARREENVFAIQTPVAIAIAVRSGATASDAPATARYSRIEGDRAAKLGRLASLSSFVDLEWHDCPDGWQEPLLPAPGAAWSALPAVTELFPWHLSGAQVKRTWPIAPDREALGERWRGLLEAADRAVALKETRDRKVTSTPRPLTGDERPPAVADIVDGTPSPPVVRYAYRAFDRQWLIADSRLIDYPRPELWRSLSERQVFMVSFLTEVLGPGPAAVASAQVPDLHYFRGSFGGRHVIPLYRDAAGTANVAEGVVERLREALELEVEAADLFAYAYCLLSSPAYVERFFAELRQPGPRLPITRSRDLFEEATTVGRTLLWLHSYGQRMVPDGRTKGDIGQGSARLVAPIPTTTEGLPRNFFYDEPAMALRVGEGTIAPVAAEVWEWSVSGLQVVASWLGYRMRDGTGRASGAGASPLDALRPTTWPARYTSELLELLWVLEGTVARQAVQADLLERVLGGPLLTRGDLLGGR